MFTIAYYKHNKVIAFSGTSHFNLPIRTVNADLLKTFSTTEDAEKWERKNHHLTGNYTPVIIREERARDLIKFFIRWDND